MKKKAYSIVRSFPNSISILKWSRFYSTSELPGQSYFHSATALHSAEIMKICFHDNFSLSPFCKNSAKSTFSRNIFQMRVKFSFFHTVLL